MHLSFGRSRLRNHRTNPISMRPAPGLSTFGSIHDQCNIELCPIARRRQAGSSTCRGRTRQGNDDSTSKRRIERGGHPECAGARRRQRSCGNPGTNRSGSSRERPSGAAATGEGDGDAQGLQLIVERIWRGPQTARLARAAPGTSIYLPTAPPGTPLRDFGANWSTALARSLGEAGF
jgi:hypothetical protein